MTKRVLLLVPEGLTFDMLTEEQRQAIRSVFGEFVNPMPYTKAYNGMQVVDALTNNSFDPSLMSLYGINWPIIGMWQRDVRDNKVKTLQEIDENEFLKYLPDVLTLNEETGAVVSSESPTFKIPHILGNIKV